MFRPQRFELLLFLTCFFAFAYFNQGGGWNQNARFAEVRAIVEQGRFAIDDYLVYKRDPGGDDLVRLPVERAEFTFEGQRYRLCWVGMAWDFTPIGDLPLGEGVKEEAMVSVCASGDVGYVPADGHFHPNKPPGTQLLAVPGYFLIYHLERWLGVNPDSWWYLNLNAWLTSILSVGLASALGCVLFFRLAREFAGGALGPALLTTLAFAFGTTFFPFATLLFDHNLTAAFFIAAFYCLRQAMATRSGAAAPHPTLYAALAGLCAGLAVLTNYPAGLGVVALGLYAWLQGGVNFRRALDFCAGGLGPAIILCLYSWSCYGGPFRLSNDFQSPLFIDHDAFLGMFKIPRTAEDGWRIFWVAKVLLYSGYRGVFFFSPVLLMSLGGLVLWWRRGERGTAALCFGTFALFYLMNTFFNGFHAGFSAGPRYLIPGLPFLALPLVAAFRRWPRATGVLAVVSVALNTLLTATDAQNPTGVGSHARIADGRDDNQYNLITQYAWPLFIHGGAAPLLVEQEALLKQLKLDDDLANRAAENLADQDDRKEAEEKAGKLKNRLGIAQRDFETLSSLRGPVSVNPVGVFEGMLSYDYFEAGSPQARWASFNVGEFIWPGSRWSLLPLVLVSGGLAAAAAALARKGKASEEPRGNAASGGFEKIT